MADMTDATKSAPAVNAISYGEDCPRSRVFGVIQSKHPCGTVKRNSVPSNNTMQKTLEFYTLEQQSTLKQFAVQRLETFVNWPIQHIITRVSLAEAGFIYTGYKDTVQCVSCLLKLSNWEAGDTAEGEHMRWSRDCLRVRNRHVNTWCPTCRKYHYCDFCDVCGKVHEIC